MKTVEWSLIPGVSVGPLKFGMTKEQVLDVMKKWMDKFDGFPTNFSPKVFSKTRYASGETEDWKYMHLHYDASGKLEAVEVWNHKGFSVTCPIYTNQPMDVKLFTVSPTAVSTVIKGFLSFSPQVSIDIGQRVIICRALSMAVCFESDSDAVDNVLFGKKGYYK